MSRMLEALKRIEAKQTRLSDKKPISSRPVVESAASDSFAIDETLVRAEAAVASALSSDEPDIYEDMARYILAQLTPGQSAALLFTSLDDDTEKSEMLRSLSKTLIDKCDKEVFVLDALPDKGGMQHKITPDISKNWGLLLEQLKTRHQLVLIDAPSLANAQAAEMISQCDGVYLAIRLGYATPYQVRQAVRIVQQAGGRLLGSIAIAPGESSGW